MRPTTPAVIRAPTRSPPRRSRSAAIATEEEYNSRARRIRRARPLHAPERAARRAALETWLMKQLREALDRGHLEEAYDQLKQALTLWDAEELAGKINDDGAARRRRAHRAAFRKRGAHEEVLVALIARDDARARRRAACARATTRSSGWLRAGGATESEIGARRSTGAAASSRTSRRWRALWPSPFVVDELTRLYFERHDAGIAESARPRRRRAAAHDLRALFGGPAPVDGVRSGAPLPARLRARRGRRQAAARSRRRSRATSRCASSSRSGPASRRRRPTPSTWRGLLAQGHDDADVAERVCVDATARFPRRPSRTCARADRDGARSARRRHARVRSGAPARSRRSREIWEPLARLWQSAPVRSWSATRTWTCRELEPQLKKVEAFHAAAQKQFPGEPIHPSLAGALFEVGRGYYNAGQDATRRWSTSSARSRSSRRRPRSS